MRVLRLLTPPARRVLGPQVRTRVDRRVCFGVRWDALWHATNVDNINLNTAVPG